MTMARVHATMLTALALALVSTGTARSESPPSIDDLERKELGQLNIQGTLWEKWRMPRTRRDSVV